MLPASVRILVCTSAQDLRRSFDGLALVARELLGEDPQSGAIFCFIAAATACCTSECTERAWRGRWERLAGREAGRSTPRRCMRCWRECRMRKKSGKQRGSG
jgi:hypothetical protein